jgi:anhydro-N-acetylmuramic acid kinase
VLATLTRLTAQSIADSYRRWLPTIPHEIIINGGGCLNRTLMRDLAHALAPIPVRSIARDGLPPQAKEPVAFAFLGLRAFRGHINHLPHTTGASQACVLGALTRS